MGATFDEASGLWRPAGCTLDLVRVKAWAETLNLWHRSMGTRLVEIVADGVAIEMPWHDHLASRDGAGVANGVLAALLDHACALAGMVTVGSEDKTGGTMGLRVDHLAPARAGAGVRVVARGLHRADHAVTTRAEAVHPDEPHRLLAVAMSAVVARP